MASVVNIRAGYGNNLVVILSDGSKYTAAPTGNDIWLINRRGMGHIKSMYGNMLKLCMLNGDFVLAVPTGQNLWLITSGGSGPTPGSGDYSWPFNPKPSSAGGTVTSEYGPRTGGAGTFHEGMDFGYPPAVWGASVKCIGDGTIQGATSNSGYGPYITVFHGSFDGHDWYSRYGHLDSFSRWSVGQSISKGDLVGLETDGGVSSGANLHMEIHECAVGGPIINDLTAHSGSSRTAINPRDFFEQYGDGGILVT